MLPVLHLLRLLSMPHKNAPVPAPPDAITGIDTLSAICTGQFQIISGFCSITVHTGQKNFSCTKLLLSLPIPLHRYRHQSFHHFINIPATSVFSSFGINRNNHTLTSKLICRLTINSGVLIAEELMEILSAPSLKQCTLNHLLYGFLRLL